MRARTRRWSMVRARQTWRWWIVHGLMRKIICSHMPGQWVWTPQLVSFCQKNQEKHMGANMVLICAHKVINVLGNIPATERAYWSDRPYGLEQ